VRDSLSALDQCLAMGGKKLNVKNVTESLGIVSNTFLVKVLQHSFQRELVQAASLVQDAFLGGVEMKQVALGLAEALRTALFVKLRAADALLEISEEEKAEFEQLVAQLSPEAIQAGFRAMNSSLEEILKSPLPRASLEMALARLSGLGQLKSLEELISALQGGITSLPAAGGEKKNPEPLRQSPAPTAAPQGFASAPAPALTARTPAPSPAASPKPPPVSAAPSAPAATGNLNFPSFVAYLLQQKASLGALLEHAMPVGGENWATATELKIGFRKSHSFYQMQAQHKANFEQLERHLGGFLQRKVRLTIEALPDDAAKAAGVVSMVEKEKQGFAQTAAEKKKKFLEHEIVRNTKEIFGAELSSFDIDRSKL
jgi:DNA polymerase III gamma/tau subunit